MSILEKIKKKVVQILSLEDDFVDETLVVEFKVGERAFKYKYITGGQQLDALTPKEIINEQGEKELIRLSLIDLKLGGLIEIPYSKEAIQKRIGINKEWSKLSVLEKRNFMGKLKPTLLSKILIKITKLENEYGDALKKSYSP